ncbi:class II glutamine amidotransferase [Streptomyces sp. NBC_00453]|uniref:class II glutamine amidotransferase n=1 Tax=Streptomyces sp. NBC_00453 TaxID=2903653 RepID=UPI002E1AD9B0
MCRFIIACGRFDSVAVLDAVLGMSTGVTALDNIPTRVHPNGWGAVWRTAEGTRAADRDHRSLAESREHAGLDALGTAMLAVHVRHATLPDRIDPRFTHPLERLDDSGPWYFMHNGFLPTVYQSLGLSASAFDSAEYFDYLLPRGEEQLDIDRTLARLRAMPPGGTSGNAVLLYPRQGYVVHWTAPRSAYQDYFTLRRLRLPEDQIIASEPIPALAGGHRWETLPSATVIELPFTPQHERSFHRAA